MGEILLVRHGQANSAAKDEDSYDKLSKLGHQQAKWLGDYLRSTNAQFDHVVCGSLRRHRETAQGMGFEPTEDARLNEMRYFDLADALSKHDGTPRPSGPREFFDHIPRLMQAWSDGHLDHAHEPFAEFEARILTALQTYGTEGKRALLVTSGGVIAMVMRAHFKLEPRNTAAALLPIRNTSLHSLHLIHGARLLASFNGTPHLDAADRAFARTTF